MPPATLDFFLEKKFKVAQKIVDVFRLFFVLLNIYFINQKIFKSVGLDKFLYIAIIIL